MNGRCVSRDGQMLTGQVLPQQELQRLPLAARHHLIRRERGQVLQSLVVLGRVAGLQSCQGRWNRFVRVWRESATI